MSGHVSNSAKEEIKICTSCSEQNLHSA